MWIINKLAGAYMWFRGRSKAIHEQDILLMKNDCRQLTTQALFENNRNNTIQVRAVRHDE